MTEAVSDLDRRELIRRSFLFEGVSETILDQIAASSQLARIDKNRMLFQRGDESDALYIVVEGLIRIWVGSESGKELTITILEDGDVFGEIGLLDGLPRSASATALENTKLLLVRRAPLLCMLAEDPMLSLHVIELLCERLRFNTNALSDFAFMDLRGRLSRKLMDLALSHGKLSGNRVAFERKFSQTELANMLAVSREAINKQLAPMMHENVIEIEKGRLVILDLDRLRAMTGELNA